MAQRPLRLRLGLLRPSGGTSGGNAGARSIPQSRRVPVYATMRALGRHGIAELVDHCCALARRFGEQLSAAGGAELILPVSLNKVVVRFLAANGDHDGHTRKVLAAVQKEGVCW